PIIATAPLLALWLGTGPQVQVAIAGLASQFPMLVGTMQGLQAADARQRELMYVLSASRVQTLRFLLVPSAVPYIFAGLKIATSISWIEHVARHAPHPAQAPLSSRARRRAVRRRLASHRHGAAYPEISRAGAARRRKVLPHRLGGHRLACRVHAVGGVLRTCV